MSAAGPAWLGAAEAAALLNVSRATLYAYVSRGYVRSQAVPGSPRERAYARHDLDTLRRRTEERRDPDKAAAHALQWGMPILESSIALIDGRRLYYRGHDAVTLARSRSLQDVASLIWTGMFDATFVDDRSDDRLANVGAALQGRPQGRPSDLPFVGRAQATLAIAAARDPIAVDCRPARAARCGWRILRLLTDVATGSETPAKTIDRRLAATWRVGSRGVDVLRSALILCADHELNVSSFTARCVASAGSSPYAVVIAGLAALEGSRHGGASARVESMLAAMRSERRLRNAIGARLQRGEALDGFGHPLYAHGDPRATMLLDLLRRTYARSPELRFVQEFADAARASVRELPNLDFALAALARVMRLPPGSPMTIFAIGRTIGWIGHAIEQYATGQLIRPRAKYVGVVPTVV